MSRYFPTVARGEGGPAFLFVVKSATGAVVLTAVKPASEVGPFKRTGEVPTACALVVDRAQIGLADRGRAEHRDGGKAPLPVRAFEAPPHQRYFSVVEPPIG